VLRSGGRSGKQFGLNRGRNTVGRDSSQADIVLDEDTVSGEHARVQFEHGQFYVYDLASTNGTYVNNRRVQKQMLMDGDTLRFGNAQMVFKRVD
jgi:pSer/pThr/pTyr-binding forkhead associated (FHA) protein